MSQRPTFDPSSFERLLAAAWVLQQQHEQEARNRRPAPDETLAQPSEIHAGPHCVSERDTTNARLMAALGRLSKAANRLQVSPQVRCANCDNESDSRCRFCAICGAPLLEPQPTPQTEPPAQSKPAREQVPPVGGSSSFLGLADETDGSFAYLLEGDVSSSHWGRVLVLVVFLGCVTAAAWHWRCDLRDWAAKFSQRPAATQPEQVSYSAAPISILGSEAAGAVPNAQGEGTAQPAQPQSGGNKAAQENTVGTAERFPRPRTVPAQAHTPAGGTLLTTKPASKKHEPAVAAGSSAEGPTRESMVLPGRPKVQAAAASNQGDAFEAEGEGYLYGTGTAANCARARRDLIAAAKRSSTKAESVLGTMYATGHCVTRDLPLAYRWFVKALQQEHGNDRFERDLQLLWNQMTPDERQIAMHRQ